MDSTCCTHVMAELFQAHGIRCLQHEGIAYPQERLPAIRATWYPGESVGRLNVDVFLQDKRLLQESFAGLGCDDRAAFAQALENFCSNSLHVLLAALWGVADQERVTHQRWQIGEQRFDAYIGHLGLRGTPRIPDGFLDAITATIRSMPLDNSLHWLRNYYFSYQQHRTVEALCDGELYQAGIDTLAGLDWEATDELFSVRNFLMLIPVQAAAGV